MLVIEMQPHDPISGQGLGLKTLESDLIGLQSEAVQLGSVAASAFLSHEARVAKCAIETGSHCRCSSLEVENASARALIADLMSQVDSLLVLNAKLVRRQMDSENAGHLNQ